MVAKFKEKTQGKIKTQKNENVGVGVSCCHKKNI